jgi:hypothetical protein
LIICIGFALRNYLWPSLVKVLEVLIHPPPLRRHPFPTYLILKDTLLP